MTRAERIKCALYAVHAMERTFDNPDGYPRDVAARICADVHKLPPDDRAILFRALHVREDD